MALSIIYFLGRDNNTFGIFHRQQTSVAVCVPQKKKANTAYKLLLNQGSFPSICCSFPQQSIKNYKTRTFCSSFQLYFKIVSDFATISCEIKGVFSTASSEQTDAPYSFDATPKEHILHVSFYSSMKNKYIQLNKIKLVFY